VEPPKNHSFLEKSIDTKNGSKVIYAGHLYMIRRGAIPTSIPLVPRPFLVLGEIAA
jgi:hypothetical protein